ncbi:MAG: (2Fe-2S) ferredoxin domain-containing protein [Bacilli bacterium]|jgi:NADP-reducing hydrogenase subunit HndB
MKLADLKKIKEEGSKKLFLKEDKNYRIVVGLATCGISAGANVVYDELKKIIKKQNLNVDLVSVGCMGQCALEPIVEVYDKKGTRTTYGKVKAQDAIKIIESHILANTVVEELLLSKLLK